MYMLVSVWDSLILPGVRVTDTRSVIVWTVSNMRPETIAKIGDKQYKNTACEALKSLI